MPSFTLTKVITAGLRYKIYSIVKGTVTFIGTHRQKEEDVNCNVETDNPSINIFTRSLNLVGSSTELAVSQIKSLNYNVDILKSVRNSVESYGFLINLPSALPTTEKMKSISSCLQKVFNVKTLDRLIAFNQHLVTEDYSFTSSTCVLIGMLEDHIHEKVIYMLKALVDKLIEDNMNFPSVFQTIFSHSEHLTVLLGIVVSFLEKKMNEYEQNYQKEKQEAKKLPGYSEEEFNNLYKVHPETGKRAVQFFEKAVKYYFIGMNPTGYCISELSNYCRNWMSIQMYISQAKSKL